MSRLTHQFHCKTSQRRERIRNANAEEPKWNGIDFIEPIIEEGPSRISCSAALLHLLCPEDDHRRLESSIELRDSRGLLVSVKVTADCLHLPIRLIFTPPLNEGRYTVWIRDKDAFDPASAQAAFEVRATITDVDPRAEAVCPPPKPAEPEVNYLARDYQSFRQLILDRMAIVMPDWKERHAADLGMTLVELLAYAGDQLSYYQDAVATEAYLGTARSRISVRRHARLVDYTLHEGSNARTFLQIEVAGNPTFDARNVYFITRPINPKLKNKTVLSHHELDYEPAGSFVGFETLPLPLASCPLEDRHGLNWVAFLALLQEPADELCRKLAGRFPDALMKEIGRFLETSVLRVPRGLLEQVLEALNAVLDQSGLWQWVPERWCRSIRTQIEQCYARDTSALPRLNRMLLQLAFPQCFCVCRSLDGITASDSEPLESLLFPEEQPRRVLLREDHNQIRFYPWDQQDCCLPKGATSATLIDADQAPYEEQVTKCSRTAERLTWKRRLNLKPGDLLLLKEVKGPKTGHPADADPFKRQVVRLTKVCYCLDPLHGQPICEVEWAHEDQLKFPLCISSMTSGPDCQRISCVSLALGNILLIDHGITVNEPRRLGHVPGPKAPACGCKSEGCGCQNRPLAEKTPRFFLEEGTELTFAVPVSPCASAASLWDQDPAQALPALDVAVLPVDPLAESIHIDQPRARLLDLADLETKEQLLARLPELSEEALAALLDLLPPEWDDFVNRVRSQPPQSIPQLKELSAQLLGRLREAFRFRAKAHLMDSTKDDAHFALEIDNNRRAHVRFGNGHEGKRPEPESAVWASYRVGNGPVGNLGPDKLSVLVYRDVPVTGIVRLTNPLSARGGSDPESHQLAKLQAPHAFRSLERAIIAEDYRRLVMRDFAGEVQQVQVTMNRLGARTIVSVAMDPLDGVRNVETLIGRIRTQLMRYARMGHEIDVREAIYVPLHIEMTVMVRSGYLKGPIQRELLAIFSDGLLADGGKGFFHPDSFTFGDSIYLSRLIAAGKRHPGVANVRVDQLRRGAEAPDSPEAQRHRDEGVLRLEDFEIAQIHSDPSRPEGGTFVLNMEGGQ